MALVLVVAGAELGKHALTVGRDDGVQIGAEIGFRVLREDGFGDVVTIHGDRVRAGVLTQREVCGVGGGQGDGEERAAVAEVRGGHGGGVGKEEWRGKETQGQGVAL